MSRTGRGLTLFLTVLLCLPLLAGRRALALDADYEAAHTAVLYDISAGMPFSESNAIAQTADGFLYIGCYGGLLRYDGRTFSQVDGVTGVVGLCADSRGRLWIAANGASCLENGALTTYTTEDGLPSNTLRDITEDAAGNVYFATTAGLAVLGGTGTIRTLDDARLRDAYVEDVGAEGGRIVYGCTRDGAVFSVEGLRVTGYRDAEELGAGIACVYPDPDRAGRAYFGTTGSEILHGSLDEPPGAMERLAVPRLRTFNALTRANGYLWVCADNGIAYIDGAGTARLLRYAPMTGMVSDVLRDHEGSIWFASARQGVMKLAESLFTDVSGKSALGERVVNTTWKKDGILYVGTDTGLVTMDEDLRVVETDISRLLSDARIRAIEEDSRGNLWFCSFHENALVCLRPDGSMDRYNRENGLLSNYARTIYECADGRMVLSVSGGVQFFRDGELVETLDETSGMKNTVILSLCEDDGGTLYLGSNGEGVYEVRGDRVVPFAGENDTSSGVILMMKNDPARDVVWVITGNALACIRDGALQTLRGFPSRHCYDLLFAENGGIWVLAADGIYYADGDAVLSGEPPRYAFYNAKNGVRRITTPNSRSYVSPEGDAYIAGSDGILGLNVNRASLDSARVLLRVPYVEADGKRVYAPEGAAVTVGAGTKRVTFHGFALSYAMTEENISFWLEGFDEHPYLTTKSELAPVSYTNLPGGSYRFRLAALDSVTGETTAETAVTLVKEKAIHERPAFWAALALALVLLGAALTRALLRRQAAKAAKKREQERIGKELGMAASIQADSLPRVFPAFPDRAEFDVYASMDPAKEVGGDFYDFFLVDGDHLALVVADVSGKGVPAALFMMISKTLVKDTADQGLSPARVMNEVNARLCDNNKNNMFVTVWLGVYEISTGTLTYADAGHEKPLLYHGGKWSFLPKHNGVALAMLEPELLELEDDPAYVDETVRLAPGDVLLQYTDGVPEATNARNELFGEERLLAAADTAQSAEPQALLRHIRARVDGFVKGAPQFDDITMLALRVNQVPRTGEETA